MSLETCHDLIICLQDKIRTLAGYKDMRYVLLFRAAYVSPNVICTDFTKQNGDGYRLSFLRKKSVRGKEIEMSHTINE